MRTPTFSLFLFILFTAFSSLVASAQSTDRDDFPDITEWILEMAEPTDDPDAIQGMIDQLNDLLLYPVNLNHATETDLQKVFFLNDFQVKSILNYRDEYGPFLSVNELLLVTGIRNELFEKIRYFVTATEGSVNPKYAQIHNRVKSDLMIRYKYRFELPAGFTEQVDSMRRFTGKNRYLMARYEISAGRKIKAGFIAEQDPGEPLFTAHNKLRTDHLSGFFEFNSAKRPLKFIAGDFKAGFGQGLVHGHSFINRTSTGIILPGSNKLTRSLSTSESGHLRGAALQTGYRKLMVTTYFSSLNLDATVNLMMADGKEIPYFTSIQRTGLHRNIAEVKNRNTLRQTNAGLDLSYDFKFMTVGLYSEKIHFSMPKVEYPYHPGIDPPEYISNFTNFSLHYRASLPRGLLFGEWAMDHDGHLAVVNGITTQLHPLAALSMIYRNYSPTYTSFYGSGFGKTSGVRNEEGFYISLNMHPLPFLSIACNADHYSFPAVRSNMPSPSTGSDYMVTTIWTGNRDFQFTIRYKISNQQMKTSRNETGIDLTLQNRLSSWRFVSKYNINESIIAESRFELTTNYEYPDYNARGSYLGQKLILRLQGGKTNIYGSYGLFDAPDWKNRIYIYEHDLLYDFSIPALYRKGSRLSLMLRTKIRGNSDIWIKYYITQYPSIIERGSGADKIVSDRDSGLKVQVRMKF